MTLKGVMIAVAIMLFCVAAYLAIHPVAPADPSDFWKTATGHAPAQQPADPSNAKSAKPAIVSAATTSRAGGAAAESGPLQVGLRAKPAQLGEQIMVTIEVPVRRALGAIGLTLNYDPRRLHLMSVTKGELLGGSSGDKPSVEEPSAGIAIIHASVRGASPRIGPGSVLVMHFETLERGVTEARITDVDLGAPDATLLGRQREARATIHVE